MGNQRRSAGIFLFGATLMVESMIPQLSPWVGMPVVFLCLLGFATSIAPERVRLIVHGMDVFSPIIPHIDRGIDWIIGFDLKDEGTIPGYEALQMYTEARPNSYEANAINLADAACLGKITAWGRPKNSILSDAPMAPKQIPTHVWEYAMIDTTFVCGPMPKSDMTYRQKFIKPHVEDDRTLYESVQFNKKEMMEICRAESISASKKPAKRIN